MSKNVVTPKSVSFEDALRNLAGRLTGRSAAELPRTQEGVVQFMAENIPTADELAEAIIQEVLARMAGNGEAGPATAELILQEASGPAKFKTAHKTAKAKANK